MNTRQLINQTTGNIVLESMFIADTFWSRFIGLMGKTLNEGEGLLIKPCKSIHCFFMKISIDVLFIDADNRVIMKLENMKPWTISPIVRHAKSVVEGSAGAFKTVNPKDQLMFV